MYLDDNRRDKMTKSDTDELIVLTTVAGRLNEIIMKERIAEEIRRRKEAEDAARDAIDELQSVGSTGASGSKGKGSGKGASASKPFHDFTFGGFGGSKEDATGTPAPDGDPPGGDDDPPGGPDGNHWGTFARPPKRGTPQRPQQPDR